MKQIIAIFIILLTIPHLSSAQSVKQKLTNGVLLEIETIWEVLKEVSLKDESGKGREWGRLRLKNEYGKVDIIKMEALMVRYKTYNESFIKFYAHINSGRDDRQKLFIEIPFSKIEYAKEDEKGELHIGTIGKDIKLTQQHYKVVNGKVIEPQEDEDDVQWSNNFRINLRANEISQNSADKVYEAFKTIVDFNAMIRIY